MALVFFAVCTMVDGLVISAKTRAFKVKVKACQRVLSLVA